MQQTFHKGTVRPRRPVLPLKGPIQEVMTQFRSNLHGRTGKPILSTDKSNPYRVRMMGIRFSEVYPETLFCAQRA